jgi:hypothetical protein
MAATVEQKKRLLRAKIAVAIQDETGKAPTEEQINQVFFLSRVMWKAVLGLHSLDVFRCKRPKCPNCVLSPSDIIDIMPYLQKEYPDYEFKLEIKAKFSQGENVAASMPNTSS